MLKTRILNYLLNYLLRRNTTCTNCKKKIGMFKFEFGHLNLLTEGYFSVRENRAIVIIPDLDGIKPTQFATMIRRYLHFPIYDYPTDFKLKGIIGTFCQECFGNLACEDWAEMNRKIVELRK